MKKRTFALMATGAVAAGIFVGAAYAKEKAEEKINSKANLIKASAPFNRNGSNKKMIKTMKENGFEDLANALEKGDYKTIDNLINNLSDEDYKKIISLMKKSGYESMAKMMESISKEDMIRMHNAMGGAAACHGNNDSLYGAMEF
jgi:radical SAM superfamily enzyme YgiQ (UPF0313 family)